MVQVTPLRSLLLTLVASLILASAWPLALIAFVRPGSRSVAS